MKKQVLFSPLSVWLDNITKPSISVEGTKFRRLQRTLCTTNSVGYTTDKVIKIEHKPHPNTGLQAFQATDRWRGRRGARRGAETWPGDSCEPPSPSETGRPPGGAKALCGNALQRPVGGAEFPHRMMGPRSVGVEIRGSITGPGAIEGPAGADVP